MDEKSKGKIKYTIKDSGLREDYPTGRGRFDLITPEPQLRLAKVFQLGRIKYPETVPSWKIKPWSTHLDCLKSHINEFELGLMDEDKLAHAYCRLHMLMWQQHHKPELCDLENLKYYHNGNKKLFKIKQLLY